MRLIQLLRQMSGGWASVKRQRHSLCGHIGGCARHLYLFHCQSKRGLKVVPTVSAVRRRGAGCWLRATIGGFVTLPVPVALMSSFSRGTQRVNGCWDYAMACQKPFSSLPPTPPLPKGRSQIRHSCTFGFRCMWRLLAPAEEEYKDLVSGWKQAFPSPAAPLPLPPAPQGGSVVVRIYDRWRGQYLCRVSNQQKHLYDFLTTKVKAGLSLTASKRSSTSRLDLAEVKDPQQMCPIRRP